jgi:hypothetical protein
MLPTYVGTPIFLAKQGVAEPTHAQLRTRLGPCIADWSHNEGDAQQGHAGEMSNPLMGLRLLALKPVPGPRY